MKIFKMLRQLIFPESGVIGVNSYRADSAQMVAVEEMAVFACVNLLAGIISKCEFKTYLGHKLQRDEDYYTWNYSPNRNQNSVQFIQELVAKLLLCNEVLVVEAAGQLLVADSYQRKHYILLDDEFTDVTCEDFTVRKTFRASDVLYLRLNDTDVRAAMSRLYDHYGQAIWEAFDKYQKSGGKSGIVEISSVAAGHPDFEKNLDTLMNDRFKRFFSQKNAVLPLNDGYKFTPITSESSKKTTSEVSDIRTLTDQALERSANAFKIAPQLLRGDVTNIDDAIDATLTFAADPIIRQLEVEINRKRYGAAAIGAGTFLRIDSTRIKHMDLFRVADKADKLIAARLYSTNELREKVGDQPIDQPWADEYLQTKNYDRVDPGDGGNTA